MVAAADLVRLADQVDLDGTGRILYEDFVSFIVQYAAGGSSSSSSSSSGGGIGNDDTDASRFHFTHKPKPPAAKAAGSVVAKNLATATKVLKQKRFGGGRAGQVRFCPGIGKRSAGLVAMVDENSPCVTEDQRTQLYHVQAMPTISVCLAHSLPTSLA